MARRYWLFKSEPDVFGFEDLVREPDHTAYWDGIRNYQARNFLRDDVRPKDQVIFYHSNAKPPHVAGLAEVVRGAYPDPTQFDPSAKYYDPKSDPASPRWVMVDVRATHRLARQPTLAELRAAPTLEGMMLLAKGSRLSIQPVSAEHFRELVRLAGGKRPL